MKFKRSWRKKKKIYWKTKAEFTRLLFIRDFNYNCLNCHMILYNGLFLSNIFHKSPKWAIIYHKRLGQLPYYPNFINVNEKKLKKEFWETLNTWKGGSICTFMETSLYLAKTTSIFQKCFQSFTIFNFEQTLGFLSIVSSWIFALRWV